MCSKLIRKNRVNFQINTWSILSLVFIFLILLPNLNIFVNIFNKTNENWAHIKQYLLKDYIINSLIIVVFTGLFTIIIGVSLSWIISAYNFPLRSFFKWAIILPLAIPPYIAAYTYSGIFSYTGVIQKFLRNALNLQANQKYFDIMSIKGTIFIFTIFLFPYVYIITKAFLERQSSSLIENARLLGRSPFEIFLYVVLPISRVSIIGGASLVILEVLNDYGVVQYFGVPTLSTAIFKTWFSMGDINSSIKLSAILMMMVLLILVLEKAMRGRRKYGYTTAKTRPISRQELKGIKGLLASGFCFIIFSLGFLIPALQLLQWSLLTFRKILNIEFLELIFNTFSIASLTSALIVIMAVVIANYSRITSGITSKIYPKITVAGYSIPGAIIAVGVIVLFINLDNNLYWLYKLINPKSGKLVLSTSIVMLIFSYMIRFLGIGYNSIEAGFEKVGKKYFEASRTLGMNITQTFFKVDLKMIKTAILSSFLLVFVDILKELPLTLILRPFNFNTLATKTFQYANDEMVQEAAISSMIIIIISVVSTYVFYRLEEREVR